MALNKLRQLDRNSAGVTLPKDDLRIAGLLDEQGEVDGEHHLHVQYTGGGTWTLEVVEEIDA